MPEEWDKKGIQTAFLSLDFGVLHCQGYRAASPSTGRPQRAPLAPLRGKRQAAGPLAPPFPGGATLERSRRRRARSALMPKARKLECILIFSEGWHFSPGDTADPRRKRRNGTRVFRSALLCTSLLYPVGGLPNRSTEELP